MTSLSWPPSFCLKIQGACPHSGMSSWEPFSPLWMVHKGDIPISSQKSNTTMSLILRVKRPNFHSLKNKLQYWQMVFFFSYFLKFSWLMEVIFTFPCNCCGFLSNEFCQPVRSDRFLYSVQHYKLNGLYFLKVIVSFMCIFYKYF